MQELNIALFQFLNNLSAVSFIAKVGTIIADGPIFFLPFFLIFLWMYYSFYEKDTEKKLWLMYIFYACVIAILFSFIIKQFIDIERPDNAIMGAKNLILNTIPEGSFPSDHASISVAFLTALFLTGYRKVFFAFLPWVILMLLSRIIVGVHWPFDIVAGTLIGILSGYIATQQLTKIKLVKKFNLFIIQLLSYIKL